MAFNTFPGIIVAEATRSAKGDEVTKWTLAAAALVFLIPQPCQAELDSAGSSVMSCMTKTAKQYARASCEPATVIFRASKAACYGPIQTMIGSYVEQGEGRTSAILQADANLERLEDHVLKWVMDERIAAKKSCG